GSGVAAVAVAAALALAPASRARASSLLRWLVYLAAGVAASALAASWVVVVLIGCGLAELAATAERRPVLSTGSLVWVAFKVGALSYGGGFVIVPLMQGDAVHVHHWLTATQFTTAVALGQVTPGPVVHTVAAVGYAAAGVGGGLLAAAVAFAPSFAFILIGADRFDRMLRNPRFRAFLGGAAPAAIGAIIGSAVPLTRALGETWQY